jgi:hypothetical protein
MLLAQVERASTVLSYVERDEVERVASGGRLSPDDRDDLRRLASDLRSWSNSALKVMGELGLTPRSRMALGVDAVRAEEGIAALIAEGREIRGERGA